MDNLSFYPKNPLNNSVENYKTIFIEPGVKSTIDAQIKTNIRSAYNCLNNIGIGVCYEKWKRKMHRCYGPRRETQVQRIEW
jgi:hypothetical protein